MATVWTAVSGVTTVWTPVSGVTTVWTQILPMPTLKLESGDYLLTEGGDKIRL